MKPWAYCGIVAFACLIFLSWNAFANDPQATAWNNSDVPPDMAQLPLGQPGSLTPDTAPAGIGGPMRRRQYPGSLANASFSIIGEI